MNKHIRMDLDERLLELLKEKPISTTTLAYAINEPSFRVCKRMAKLEKYGLIKKITAQKISFWQAAGMK